MNVEIDSKLRKITNDFNVGILECDIKIYNEKRVNDLIKKVESEIVNSIEISEVINLDTIIDGRNAYKKYGKDPSRYRLAVESLYRRITKGNTLYRINNVVDIGNLVSLKTRRSVAVLDSSKIKGDILIRLGKKDDKFEGIGRGKLNVENIPVYTDKLGPFGSTTSDTARTMITNKTTKILFFIISFNGKKNLVNELKYTFDLYRDFANATNPIKYIK